MAFVVPPDSITDYILGRVEDGHDAKPALIDGVSGKAMSRGELREAIGVLAGQLV